MSRAERSLAVKAPTVTAPPCGICLHQQLCTMSVAVEAGDDCVFCLYWTSQYFTLSPSLPSQTKMLFKKKNPKKPSPLPLPCLFHLSRFVLRLLCPRSLIGFLHLAFSATLAIFNSSHLPSKEPPPHPPSSPPPPTLPPHNTIPVSLLGVWEVGGRGGLKDKDESEQKETNRQTNTTCN